MSISRLSSFFILFVVAIFATSCEDDAVEAVDTDQLALEYTLIVSDLDEEADAYLASFSDGLPSEEKLRSYLAQSDAHGDLLRFADKVQRLSLIKSQVEEITLAPHSTQPISSPEESSVNVTQKKLPCYEGYVTDIAQAESDHGICLAGAISDLNVRAGILCEVQRTSDRAFARVRYNSCVCNTYGC